MTRPSALDLVAEIEACHERLVADLDAVERELDGHVRARVGAAVAVVLLLVGVVCLGPVEWATGTVRGSVPNIPVASAPPRMEVRR